MSRFTNRVNPSQTSAGNGEMSGGFIPASGLLSPPPSSVASSSATGSTLPTPRSHPLRAGSQKEAAYINYVDRTIQDISRKFALRDAHPELNAAASSERAEQAPVRTGYASFREAARDLDKLIDVVWVSGTLSLQVPHLLSLALLVLNYIPAFPPSPRALFRVLDKLDTAFASLITGEDVQTGNPLPSQQGGGRRAKVNGTEKVRIKSLVERTRVVVMQIVGGEVEFEDESDFVEGFGAVVDGDRPKHPDEVYSNNDGEDTMDLDALDMPAVDWEMELARVYSRTLNELGDELVGPAIGIGPI